VKTPADPTPRTPATPSSSKLRERQAPKRREKRGPASSSRWLARTREKTPFAAARPPVFDGTDVGFFEAGDAIADDEEGTKGEARGEDVEEGTRGALEADVRRRRLTWYVAAACAICAAVCGIALGRARSVEGGLESWAMPTTTAMIATATTTVTVPTVTTPTMASAEPVAPPASAAPQAQGASAIALREAARRALERAQLLMSIELATSAIEADPSDADAWLILGAAQQAAGDLAAATATFSQCTHVAKRGAVGECFAMLR
jgi:hypothetical protein